MKLFVSDHILDIDLRELRRVPSLLRSSRRFSTSWSIWPDRATSTQGRSYRISLPGGRVVSDSTLGDARLARDGIRQCGDFVGALTQVLTAAARYGRTGRRRKCVQELRRAAIFHSPGSQIKCRSSRTSSTNTVWKHSAAQAWTSPGLGCVSVIEASPDQS